jgi:hypothetical protein
MFFLNEKLMTTVPLISTWNNHRQKLTKLNRAFTDMDNGVILPNGEFASYNGAEKEIKDWEERFTEHGSIMQGGIIRDTRLSFALQKETNKNIDGISSEFAKIKNNEQLIDFATTYGNLGLYLPQDIIYKMEQIKKFDPSVSYTIKDIFDNVQPGPSYFEPFELWWHQIDKVRKILKLHRTLSRINRGFDTEIEDRILIIGKEVKEKISAIGEKTYSKKTGKYYVNWYDGTFTDVIVLESDLMDFKKIGYQVLSNSIKQFSRGIQIEPSDVVETPKKEARFYFLEKKTTEYLITAIYYDLWDLINHNLVVEICQNPECKLPFMKVKRQQYCDDACKQEAYRIRKAATDK